MFKIESRDKETKARTGLLKTAHGDIPTPIFMPVGTGGTVKGILQRDLSEDINAKIILGNTYHLYLRPGTEILQALLENFLQNYYLITETLGKSLKLVVICPQLLSRESRSI